MLKLRKGFQKKVGRIQLQGTSVLNILEHGRMSLKNDGMAGAVCR